MVTTMTKEIQLTKGMVALIDDEDFEKVNQYKWYAMKGKRTYYATSARPCPTVLLHRFIMNTPLGMEIDHKDGDGLNCQKYNLRICTQSQNAQGKKKRITSQNPYKGIQRRVSGNWQAFIGDKPLGTYPTAEAAARAYDKAAREIWGEFARLNFPDE